MVSGAILYDVWLKADLLGGQLLHRYRFQCFPPCLWQRCCWKCPTTEGQPASQWKCVYWTLFFMKKRFPLDPESSRTLIVLYLTFSPELTLGSGILAQSEHALLLVSSKLVQFSSKFFNLDANFFSIRPFLNFWERFLGPREFSSRKSALSTFGEKASHFRD